MIKGEFFVNVMINMNNVGVEITGDGYNLNSAYDEFGVRVLEDKVCTWGIGICDRILERWSFSTSTDTDTTEDRNIVRHQHLCKLQRCC